MLIIFGLEMLLALTSVDIVVLYFLAMLDKVSPFMTVWIIVGSLMLCPILIIFGLEMLLSLVRMGTVVLYFLAMLERVSPFVTT